MDRGKLCKLINKGTISLFIFKNLTKPMSLVHLALNFLKAMHSGTLNRYLFWDKYHNIQYHAEDE